MFLGSTDEELQFSSEADTSKKRDFLARCSHEEDASPKLLFFLEGQQLERELTMYQAIMRKQIKENETVTTTKLWSKVYTLTYRKAATQSDNLKERSCSVQKSAMSEKGEKYLLQTSNFSSIFASEVASELEKSSPTHDILYLLKCLERMNKFIFHLISQERIGAFAEGKLDHLDNLKIAIPSVPQIEFVSSKLTEKLEQQMRDLLAVSIGGMPSWCNQLMASCPFLFSFEAKSKFFRLAAFGQFHCQPHEPPHSDSGMANDRRLGSGGTPRKKFLVFRNNILGSAEKIMDLHAHHKVPLEVEYYEEVGTGLGPTLEFYTLVSHEFQKAGLGMWREDHGAFYDASLCVENTKFVTCPLGLFPRPWPSLTDASNGIRVSEVNEKFVLLGQIVAKALQDGRVLDLHFSKAFYKLILGQVMSYFLIIESTYVPSFYHSPLFIIIIIFFPFCRNLVCLTSYHLILTLVGHC